MIGSKISAIEYYFPKNKENNAKFKKNNPKVNIERIKEKKESPYGDKLKDEKNKFEKYFEENI